jgi:hypothetical protein
MMSRFSSDVATRFDTASLWMWNALDIAGPYSSMLRRMNETICF